MYSRRSSQGSDGFEAPLHALPSVQLEPTSAGRHSRDVYSQGMQNVSRGVSLPKNCTRFSGFGKFIKIFLGSFSGFFNFLFRIFKDFLRLPKIFRDL